MWTIHRTAVPEVVPSDVITGPDDPKPVDGGDVRTGVSVGVVAPVTWYASSPPGVDPSTALLMKMYPPSPGHTPAVDQTGPAGPYSDTAPSVSPGPVSKPPSESRFRR